MEIVKAEKVRRYSNSMLDTYRACSLKFAFKYQHRLVTIQPESRHDADFGNAWDAGLTALYRDGDAGKALDAFAAAYPQSRYPSTLPMRSLGKTFANGLHALVEYADKWEEEDKHWTVLHVQERNDQPDSDKILKLDLVVRDDRDGQIWGIDHKTTSSYLNNDYWKYYEPNSQVRFYADYITNKFGHCGGFIINAASFKHRSNAWTPKDGPLKGEKQPAGDWHSFARMTFNPNANALSLERDNFDYWVGRIEADRLSNSWGYNTQSCHMFGRECEYYKICSSGYSWPQDEELILSDYRQCCPRVLDGGRCQLDLGHAGECDPTVVVVAVDNEIELDDEIEEAVK